MWSFLRRQTYYFLIGFVATFVIYLFVRFDANDVILGVAVGAIGGLIISGGIFYLEHRFPDRTPTPPDQ